MNIEALTRFADSDNDFRLTKIDSKRENWNVPVGRVTSGGFNIHTWEASDDKPEQKAVEIIGRGFSYLRTSPIVRLVDQDEKSTIFETEGGFYKLEKLDD